LFDAVFAHHHDAVTREFARDGSENVQIAKHVRTAVPHIENSGRRRLDADLAVFGFRFANLASEFGCQLFEFARVVMDTTPFRHLLDDWFSVERRPWFYNERDVFKTDVSHDTIMETEERLMQFRDDEYVNVYNFDATEAFKKIEARIDQKFTVYQFCDFPRVRQLHERLRKPLETYSIVTGRIWVTNKDAPRFCAVCWGKCMTYCSQRPGEPLHAMHVICRLYLQSQMLGECVCACTYHKRGLCGWMMGDLDETDETITKQRTNKLRVMNV